MDALLHTHGRVESNKRCLSTDSSIDSVASRDLRGAASADSALSQPLNFLEAFFRQVLHRKSVDCFMKELERGTG
jgi:hypothetical protein